MTAAQPSRLVNTAPSSSTAARARRRARTSRVSARSLRRAGVAVATMATLCLTAYIGEYASLAKAGHESARLHAELRRARQENSNLHARVEILERPERIDHLARAMSMEQRNDADYATLAPRPAPAPKPAQRPVLAGFFLWK